MAPTTSPTAPGYFPAPKPPFWSRAKVGIAAGVLGLAVGATGASGAEESVEPDSVAVQSLVDQAVVEETSELEDRLADAEESIASAEESLAAAEESAVAAETRAEAAQQRVAAVRAQAEKAQRRAVRTAVAQERQRLASQPAPASKAAPSPSPQPLAGGGTDPRFGTCGEANDNGYGPYQSGADAEYDWYQDRDGDGLVCER